MRAYKDEDGRVVKAGDTIAFSFGIPPVRVEGTLFERHGKLIMPTPNHNPKEATIGQIKHHCELFWIVRTKEQSEALLLRFAPEALG